MLRPAFITTANVFGGAEGNLLRLVIQQMRDCVDPAVVLVHSGRDVATMYRAAHLPVSEFTLYAWEWGSPWRYLQSLYQMATPIITSRADLLHINHHWGLEYTTRAATLTRRPYLIQMRGVESIAWVRASRSYLLGAAKIVAVAQAVKARLVEGGVPESLVEVVYDGVDVAECATPATDSSTNHICERRAGDAPQVALIGRVVPLKGVADFLHAAALVAQGVPAVRFLVVGSGPERFVQEMEQLSRDLGIEERVVFTGFCHDVASMLRTVHVLVLATHDPQGGWEEACPNIVLEAMASGVPVVATASGGVVELLAEGRGLLVPPGNPEALARGIQQVLSMGDEQRQEMVERAQRETRARFSIQEQAQRFVAIYEDVVASRGAGRWR